MNRLYKFLCICGMMLTATVSHAATTADEGRIFLQHQGVIARSFAPGEMAKAIEQAAEGDTLLLANGNYASKFTISKSISIIGAMLPTSTARTAATASKSSLRARIR